MDKRIEAAAKVLVAFMEMRPEWMTEAVWDSHSEVTEEALEAADAVMFSDEAVERVAERSGYKPSVVRAIIAALKAEA